MRCARSTLPSTPTSSRLGPPLSPRSSSGPGAAYQEAIEREARRALGEGSVVRLEALGLFRRSDAHAIRLEIRELAASVAVVEELQAWVEERLAAAREDVRGYTPAQLGSPGT
jgi:hypothetical protein